MKCSQPTTSNKLPPGAVTAAKKPKEMRAIVLVLAVGALFMYADRTVLYPMLQIIAQEHSLSGAATGFISSTYFLLYVLVQVPAGLLGDRLGLKKVLVVSYLLGGTALLLLGLVKSYAMLIVLVGLHGIGMGAFYPMSYGINIGTVPKSRRGLASATINAGMSVGTALGLVFAGPIYLQTNNWRLPFLIAAVPTLMMPFCFHRYLPKPVATAVSEAQADNKQQFNLRNILADKELWALNLAVFCAGYGFWVALTWGPEFFASERALGLAAGGVFTALPALSAIPAALVAGQLSDLLGRRRLALILYPLQAASIFSLAYVQSLPILVVALILYGLVGRTVSDAIIISWFGDQIAEKNPDALGTAVGVFNLVGMSSAVIAPLISGLIKDITGSLVGAFYFGAAMVLIGTVCAAMAKEG